MLFADSDFFIALTKKSDWLKEKAEKLYEKHQGEIVTSAVTLAELLLVAQREKRDPELLVGAVFKIAKVEGMTVEQGLQAAHYMKEKQSSVFDAFAIALAQGRPIITSDKRYESLGIKTVSLKG